VVGVLSFLAVAVVTTEKIDLLTVTEAAHAIGTTRGAIHHHRLTGRLPSITVDGRYLIPKQAVEQLRRDRAAITDASKDTTGS